MASDTFHYICPKCKKKHGIGFAGSYPSSIEFCPQCGSKLIKRCPGCNEKIKKAEEDFCPYCGKGYLT